MKVRGSNAIDERKKCGEEHCTLKTIHPKKLPLMNRKNNQKIHCWYFDEINDWKSDLKG